MLLLMPMPSTAASRLSRLRLGRDLLLAQHLLKDVDAAPPLGHVGVAHRGERRAREAEEHAGGVRDVAHRRELREAALHRRRVAARLGARYRAEKAKLKQQEAARRKSSGRIHAYHL